MASNETFDITTGCDLQEVDNAVNQTVKELSQRYDFKKVKYEFKFDRGAGTIGLFAEDEYKLDAIWDVLQTKMVRRKVPVKNLHRDDLQPAGAGAVKQNVSLAQSIDTDTAKKIVKYIKEKKLKKVQASIQKDQVRVQSPSRDALQEIMGMLRAEDFGLELQFGNFRSK